MGTIPKLNSKIMIRHPELYASEQKIIYHNFTFGVSITVIRHYLCKFTKQLRLLVLIDINLKQLGLFG